MKENSFHILINAAVIMEKIILSPIDLHALLDEIREVFKQEIKKNQHLEVGEKMLSADEACKLFNPKICKATLVNWAKSGRINQYRVGRRVFYKYAEIIASMQKLKKYQHNY